ncbi:MAG: STAS domain-containing protein [Jatrophihabitans sp.]|uniref:STAS domain-containing protein n=1 Tax=Jatrophihabitans sp. TaxID=1932789 RepID=UPI003F8153D5
MDDNTAGRDFGVEVDEGAGGITTLRVRGDFDLAGAPVFQAAADGALAGGATGIVIDFAGITFIDSTGLGALVRVHTAANDTGRSLQLINVPHVAARTITIGGLSFLLETVPAEPTG